MQRCDVMQLANMDAAEQFSLWTDRELDLPSVPLYELDAAAGLVALFADSTRPAPISHLQIPAPPCDGTVYVRGDFMYPLLKSDDIVSIKRSSTTQTAVCCEVKYTSLNGKDYITIKYVQKSDVEGFVRLVSHNPHHAPQEIPRDSLRAIALEKTGSKFCK